MDGPLGVDAGSIRGEADKAFLDAVKDIFNMKTHEAILSVLYLMPPVRFALDRLKVPLVKPRSAIQWTFFSATQNLA